MVSSILVHLILVDPKEHLFGYYEADIQEVSRARLEGDVSSLDAGAWQELDRGDWGVFQGWMRQVLIGFEPRRGAIILVVFGRVGLGVDKLIFLNRKWCFE